MEITVCYFVKFGVKNNILPAGICYYINVIKITYWAHSFNKFIITLIIYIPYLST